MNISHIGQAVRSRRRELGVSQRDLAELAGVSIHTLSNLESGRGNPTLRTVAKLLEPLGFELRAGLREL